jgi:hypothetical protein
LTRLELFLKKTDILGMNDFEKGVALIGQLFPAPCPYSEYPTKDSTWEGVAKSFQQAGNDLWYAMQKCSDEREKQQTP